MQPFVKPKYIDWIIKESDVVFEDDIPLECYQITYDMKEETVLDEWATHIRRHYITDSDLVDSITRLETDEKTYLKENVIPQKEQPQGPSTISAEIAEILLYDLFEYILRYTAFRGRHWDKPTPTSPIQGTDVFAAKIANENKASIKDELCIIEVKSTLTKNDYEILENAKRHSDKDTLRYSVSLDFLRKKYRDKNENLLMRLVERFQQKANLPYISKYIAAGVISRKDIQGKKIIGIKGKDLEIKFSNQMFLIHGENLMNLAYEIYKRITK